MGVPPVWGDHRFTERMRVPGFHRRSVIGRRVRRKHCIAPANVFEVPFDDLSLVAGGLAAEVAAHRVDGLQTRLPKKRCCAAAVLLCEGRPSEVDAAATLGASPIGRHGRRT